MKTKIQLLLFASLLLAGCNKESRDMAPDNDEQGTVPVSFSLQPPTTSMQLAGIRPRMANSLWEAADSVGLYMKKAGLTFAAANVMAQAGNVKMTVSGQNLTAAATLYYPQTGNVDFVAYYPYTASVGADYTLPVNLAGQAAGLPAELLYSNNATNKAASAEPVALSFQHALAKLSITVTAGANTLLSGDDFTTMTMSVEGMYAAAKLSLADGTLTPQGAKQPITLHKSGATSTQASFDAIVLPSSENATFVFCIGSQTFRYEAAGAYEAGKSYALSFALDNLPAPQALNNAIWMLGGDFMGLVASSFTALAEKGIHHLIVNEFAFTDAVHSATVMQQVAIAEAQGLTVHVWLQCFHDSNGWLSPVDDANQVYNQTLFTAIISRAKAYVDAGIRGIHLDYVRFPGTSSSHDYPSQSVTGEGAITEFCRQISLALRAANPNVTLSAALMWEKNSEQYYGQNPAAMGQYLDILMPMIYRTDESHFTDYGAAWAQDKATYFATHSGTAQVWAGTKTYRDLTSSTVEGLTAAQMRQHCDDLLSTGVTGIALFRYGLGDLCDLSGLWE
jgi:hypothetical protein